MLILASSSPRRRELLRIARIPFIAESADINESPLPGESAGELTERLARDKVTAVAEKFPGDFILGADTVVAVDQAAGGAPQVLGKPADEAAAARMLRSLSGRTHQVVTGICLLSPVGAAPLRRERNATVSTAVAMNRISETEIAAYVATGEPLDKAGAYAIQGMASRWISGIEGCYYNVVGLPLPMVYAWLLAEGLV